MAYVGVSNLKENSPYWVNSFKIWHKFNSRYMLQLYPHKVVPSYITPTVKQLLTTSVLQYLVFSQMSMRNKTGEMEKQLEIVITPM